MDPLGLEMNSEESMTRSQQVEQRLNELAAAVMKRDPDLFQRTPSARGGTEKLKILADVSIRVLI